MKNTQNTNETASRTKRAVLFVLFALCVAVTVIFSVPALFSGLGERTQKLLSDAVPRLAVAAFLFYLLFTTPEYLGGLTVKKRGWAGDLLWSVPCFLVAFANFPYTALISGSAKIDAVQLLWLFLLKCLGVAFLEEFFFRALLVPFVRVRVKGKLAVGWTVLITAAVFGLSHLLNLFFGAGVGPTLLQVGYTFLLGCMFSVMFLKTGNVWLGVFVHFLFDIGGVIVTDLGHGIFQDRTFWILTFVTGALCGIHIVYTLIRLIREDGGQGGKKMIYDVAVVGGGIAGYTAALALVHFKHKVLWVGKVPFGEKLAAAEHVNNFPAFEGSGEELAALLTRQMEREQVPFTGGRIDGIYSTGTEFVLTYGKISYTARSVILATGVDTRRMEGEEKFLGKGVSYCAVCDGALYKDKTIACVLSSPEYGEEAEYLAGFAKEVLVFPQYENAKFRAANITVEKDVPLAITGVERVAALVCKGGEYPVDGVFLLKDASPKALVGGLETEGGHVKVMRDMSTNLQGLFAAGDVTGKPYQYVKAAGEGLVAAYSAHDFLLRAKENL